ncbi:Obscurin [Amphibalanus amphitrite]|nr:Obscurin [Amphibalanus amphitrite]
MQPSDRTRAVSVSVPNEEVKQPAFKTFPASATVTEGEPAKFNIVLEKSAAKVTWCKDGKPLDSSSTHLKMTGEKTKHQLLIPACVPTDVGQYSVRAQGKKHETSANFSLNVLPKQE